MGWFSDFLQAIPLVSVLREKLSISEAKVKELEAKDKESQAQIESLEQRNKQLEEQIHNLTRIEVIDEIKVHILLIFTEYESRDIYELEESLTHQLNQERKSAISQVSIQHHLDVLERPPLIYVTAFGMPLHKRYKISKFGRDYLAKNNLL